MKKWMPVNPCKDCDENLRSNLERVNWYGLANECLCEDKYYFMHELHAQKKLLEWQIKRVTHDLKLNPLMKPFRDWLKSILREVKI